LIVDISNVFAPSLVGKYDTSGNTLDVFVSNNYAYIASSSGFEILDISDPLNFKLAGSYKSESDFYNVFVVGNYVYLSGWENGFLILELTFPQE